ncbi:MAG: hypothetical protein JKY55_05890 [Aliivibrio sp.]|uniref:hypothetical protein n=1 Tax=Aliivibrio sp. TaxID=1872443 RepID=UPI001A5F8E6B|nr:hypothetical protein [Aliivibrio sp.]
MRYSEISPSTQSRKHWSYPSKSRQQPSWKNYRKSNLVGTNLTVRDRFLRIYEIVSVLGFADTLEIFADRFLNLGLKSVEWFLAGHAGKLSSPTIDHLNSKLTMVHNTIADEIANAADIRQFRGAKSRYNLLQTAFAHLDEFKEKLD